MAFYFSVSFIKRPGLKLLAPNIEAALARGVKGKLITSTYQNFTDIDSLVWFYDLMSRYPDQFTCRLDTECFHDLSGNAVGFHSKGYLFDFLDRHELLVGSSNITVYALLKNIEWDVALESMFGCDVDEETYRVARKEFDYLWEKTIPLTRLLIEEYKTHLMYSIERWDMDYNIANAAIRPNYMQRKALKELNRIRVMGAEKGLVCSAAGSGKTYLAAFDVLNFNPRRLLYIVHEGSILMKSVETFERVFGADKTFGIYNAEYKDFDADFVFSTNVTMSNALELFDPHTFDYIIIDEAHHATAGTYRKIIDYFQPQFLLGITATPERMDGEDVFSLFDQNVPYELRLRDAIVNRLVVPFHYYGIRDELIEYGIKETKGHKFVEQFSDDKHCDFIYQTIEKYRLPGQKLKALAFCKDISHAIRMSQAMEDYYHTRYLTGKNSTGERVRAYKDLQDDSADLEILFTVDILNEGVDVPGVNMVLFLRPTDSQTIFIQQLGRGLRNYEGKQYVTVLDFIGNDYKRSVQIAFALGGLAKNFVVEKKLLASLVAEDFKSIGLASYGVIIQLDELSKKEVLSFIDQVNFNTKTYLEQDYRNFKKYISSPDYPRHVDYLNNDYAPDLLKFMQSRIGGKKNSSYYGFLKAIGEENLPAFNERQEAFIKYVSEMLPIVRPYEYLIIQKIIEGAGKASLDEIRYFTSISMKAFAAPAFEHAITYMLKSGFFTLIESDDSQVIILENVELNTELDEYMHDLLEFGLGKYDAEFVELSGEENKTFHLWSKYRKEQVQQLLLNNPKDIMKGTRIEKDVVFAYVTVIKSDGTKEGLKYVDGYIDRKTFQWETIANVSEKELAALKASSRIEIFVRKVDNEDGIQLPFTYIGSGKMEYIEGSKKANGAHLFRVPMEVEAPEDLYFDFRLPE
jgi:superfamily II DNA or RNA helicase